MYIGQVNKHVGPVFSSAFLTACEQIEIFSQLVNEDSNGSIAIVSSGQTSDVVFSNSMPTARQHLNWLHESSRLCTAGLLYLATRTVFDIGSIAGPDKQEVFV